RAARQPSGRGGRASESERLEEFDEVGSLPGVEPQGEVSVVMVDDFLQGGEATVVVEASLLADEESAKGAGAVALVGRSHRLEVVDPDLGGRVHVPAGLRVDRRHVASRALRLAVEELSAALGRLRVEAALGRTGRIE